MLRRSLYNFLKDGNFSEFKEKGVPFFSAEKTMKEKIKNHLSSQVKRLKSEGSLPEYIFWWATRIMMIYACFKTKGVLAPVLFLAVFLNTLSTFAVSVFSFIFPQKLFFGRLSFRTQSYIDFFVLMGSFFHQYLNTSAYIDNYDKWQHFFAGFVCVFLGKELLKALLPEEKLSPKASLIGGVGFSFSAIVIWEIFEFLADFFIKGSTNQAYNLSPDFNMLFFKIFGRGAGNVEQYPLFDTLFDMMAAVVGIIVAVIFVAVFLKIKTKKQKDAEKAETVPV